VAEVPDGLVLRRHRDLAGRRREEWVRRGILGVIALVLLLGVANVFGQRPSTSEASVAAASLSVYSPARVRGGLYFETRFDIRAAHELRDAQLVLSSTWLEGMTLNTVEPSPVGEASRNGDLALDLGHVAAGDRYLLFLQFQVNPTNVGRRSLRADLYDGGRHLVTIHRKITIFP
jgi:hypothetical protein